MAIDFSDLQSAPMPGTGKINFSDLGATSALEQAAEPEDETSALGAAGRGFASMIPLGEQAVAGGKSVLEKVPYTTARQELEKEVQADIAGHEPSRLLGQAAGVIAPAVVTGGASAPASLGEAAVQGAGIGAGFGAGRAIDTLATGGTGAQAAGDVLAGAALGTVGGAAGSAVAKGLEGLSAPLQKYAANKAAAAVGMGSKELGNMTPEEVQNLGNALLDKGIVKQGASTQEMFDAAKNLHEQYGARIGEIGNQTQELGLTTDVRPMIDNLKLLEQDASSLANPDERKAAIWYRRGAADLQAMANRNVKEILEPNSITFDQLQRLKQSYGNSAFENGVPVNQAAANIYGELRDGLQNIVAEAKNKPNLPSDLKEALTGYSTMHPVVSGLQDILGRERAGNLPAKGFGMMGKMVGQLPGQKNPAINALTSMGLLGAGHPMWAVGALTATTQNPRVMAGGARAIAGALPKLAGPAATAGAQVAGSTMPGAQNMGKDTQVPVPQNQFKSPQAPAPTIDQTLEHPALEKWKPTFLKNSQNAKNPAEIKKSNAITDFVLSQRDPAFAKAKQDASDNPTPPQAANRPVRQNMAEGGIVAGMTEGPSPEQGITEPLPELGSTLEGLHDVMAGKEKSQTTVTPTDGGLAIEKVSYKTGGMHEPFNSDFADKLMAFLKEKDDAQPR